MKINIDIKIVIIIVLLLVILFGGCWGKNKYAAQYKTIDSLTLANQTTQELLNKANQKIYQQEVMLTESSSFIKNMSDSIFNLKKSHEKKVNEVIAFYSSKIKIKLDTVYIPYIEEEDGYDENGGDYTPVLQDTMLKVPKSILLDTSDIHIDMTILQKGVRLNNLSVIDTQYIRVVELKHGWLKPRTLEIQTLHTNKALTVTGQNSIIYKPKKKFGWLLKTAILAAGIFLGTKL